MTERTRHSAAVGWSRWLGALSMLTLFAIPGAASASDFWDAVRNPGLSAYRARLHTAAEALADNQPVAALTAADAAVVLLPERAEGHAMRGRALGTQGKYVAAKQAFDHALSLDPAALDGWTEGRAAATTAMRLLDFEEATRLLTRVLSRLDKPSRRAELLALQGDVLLARGPDYLRRAGLCYREALRLDPNSTAALLGLSLVLQREGQAKEALHLAARVHAEPLREAGQWALPEGERLARRGLWLMAVGDRLAATETLTRAARFPGPWKEASERAAHALEAAR